MKYYNFDKLINKEYDIGIIDFYPNDWIKANYNKYDIINTCNSKKDLYLNFPMGHGIAIKSIVEDINLKSSVLLIAIDIETKIDFINEILNMIVKFKICRIINISFGFMNLSNIKNLKRMQEICEYANKNKIIIIAAKSNDGQNSFPSSFDSVLSVDFNKNQIEDLIIRREICVFKKLKLLVPWYKDRKMWVDGNSFYSSIITGIISTYDINNYSNFFDLGYIDDVSKYFKNIKVLKA